MGRLLQENEMFTMEMGYKDFIVSTTYLHRFTICHDIKASVLSSESVDMNEEVVQNCARSLRDKCVGCVPKNIFNTDETGRTLSKVMSARVASRPRTA